MRDAVANPIVENLHTFRIQHFFFHAQEVGPFQRPKISELRTRQQLLNRTRVQLQAAASNYPRYTATNAPQNPLGNSFLGDASSPVTRS